MTRLRPAVKSIAVYLLLVAVPLAALAAILRAGGRLRAPAHVAGEWRVEAAGLPLDSAASAAFRTLAIAQSGIHLSVALAGRELRGSLRGDSLAAASRTTSWITPPACFHDGLELRARVDTAARPARMSGTLGVPGDACADLPFTAERAAPDGGRR